MNYKIKVNSEAESKEVQELFFELGGEWGFNSIQVKYKEYPYLFMTGIIIKYGKDSGFFEKHQNKEITLPELRDIVVLKRNDACDATHEDDSGCLYFFSSCDTRVYYMTKGGWVKTREADSSIKPIKKESGMLSNKEALMALANGEDVLYINTQLASSHIDWADASELTIAQIKSGDWAFKLKPKTILLNGVEFPAPFKPKEGDDCKLYYIGIGFDKCGYNWKHNDHYEIGDIVWRTEDEIKQVVAVLRKVFGVCDVD